MVGGAGKKVAAAIGNFDGVHCGHQRLIAETAAFAKNIGAAPGVMVFEPHPRRYFRPDDPPFLLTTGSERDALLREAGAETVLVQTFDAALASMSPEEFVREILFEKFNLAGVVTGSDFRFGKGRAGDAANLKRLCEKEGIATLAVEPEGEGTAGEKIGSSAIREAIADGDIRAAAKMLGRFWSVAGEVSEGQKLGRTLGFPTANLTLGELIEPRRGVYAVKVEVNGRSYDGVANFGRRPTVGSDAPLLEAHIFDFQGDLYGETIAVRFIDFIRDEQKFDGLDALKAQIEIDCKAARERLAGN